LKFKKPLFGSRGLFAICGSGAGLIPEGVGREGVGREGV